MSAVIQAPTTASRALRAASKAPHDCAPAEPDRTPLVLRAVFERASSLLRDASWTVEDHLWSGDSDRILEVAADTLYHKAPLATTIDEARTFAFDATALIKAARLVPGDTESPQRTALLERTAQELHLIIGTEASHLELIAPEASRCAKPCVQHTPPVSATADHIDFLAPTLDRAHAILTMLVDLFGGATSITTPALSTGINGTLDFLVETLAGADEVAQQMPRGVRPQSLSSHVHQARSLAELLGDMLNADDFDWCYSSGVYSNYFDAIGHAVRCAIEAMEVKNHG